ncbi:hypothetical protein GCM10020221_18830 [Streptomyces thioluteus]|uniref:Major facilitator superfamily (MFS) profile domain-containing protein n=2 Tax=Streptomyces thioluteus TaxID=66431 RepID=A0ABP6J6X8_STRTU
MGALRRGDQDALCISVLCPDVAAAVRALEPLGATLAEGPGRTPAGDVHAVVIDVRGNRLGLLEPAAPSIPAVPGAAPGLNATAFFEIGTTDFAATRKFYQEAFGWTTERDESAEGVAYYSILVPGLPGEIGGVLDLSGMDGATDYAIPTLRVADVPGTAGARRGGRRKPADGTGLRRQGPGDRSVPRPRRQPVERVRPADGQVSAMPVAVYVLGIAIFSLNTTEIMVAGLIPGISGELHVSVAAVGYLISIYAFGMVVGGPLLTVAMRRIPPKRSLIWLLVVFVVGQMIGALAQDYWVLVVARVLTALAASAFFGVGAAVCVQLVGPERRGRAMSVLYGGITVAQVVGLPAATVIEQHFGWRASFWIVDALALLCIVAVVLKVPGGRESQTLDLPSEMRVLRNGRLWGAYATNALVIGSAVTGFSYLSPVFTDAGGFSSSAVPVLFAMYGVATVVGNTLVGRFADRYTRPILLGGLIALTIVLTGFALVLHHQVPSVVATALLGLVGLPLNPAMAARVMSVSNNGALVNALNGSAINVGVAIGPWLGGLGIDTGIGLAAPLWIGAIMAFVGVLTLAPDFRQRAAPSGQPVPVASAPATNDAGRSP